MSGLPEGWVSLRAEHACEVVQSGGTPKGKPFTNAGDIPFLKVYNIVGQRIAFDYRPQYIPRAVHDSELRRSLVLPGDVLMNIVGPPLGKVALVPNTFGEWNINQALVLFRARSFLLPKFLYYFLCEGREVYRIESEYRGSAGQSNISLSQARNFEVPIAPLPEQRRIVTQVEALLADVNKAKERLDRVPLILKRFRQAVLAAACSGELTREWRDKYGFPYPRAAVVGDILSVKGGFAFPSKSFQPEGVPLVRQGNLGGNRVDLSNCVYLDPVWLETHRDFVLHRGDMLIGMSGAVGKLCVYDIDQPALQNQRTGRLVVRQDRVLHGFVPIVLEHLQPSLVQKGKGMGVLNVSATDIESLDCLVPSPEEQAEIVRRVNDLFALADAIERRVKVAKARADKLPQAILTKAFSGELVPTEAELARAEGRSYESAEELLARVRATGATAGEAKAKKAAGRKKRVEAAEG